MYVYIKSQPGLWTVGNYVGEKFYPESDHDTTEKAAARVAFLNGGASESEADDQALQSQESVTLRDFFAAHAPPMPDEWASYRRLDSKQPDADCEELELMVQWRFVWADMMLKARKAGK